MATSQVSITCPRCHHVSFHPGDIEQKYCSKCHWWTGDPQLGSPEVIAMVEAERMLGGLGLEESHGI
jgi:hypothetical protein